MALLHALRASDRLAISKLVTSLTKASVKSPLAQCLLVRYVAQVSKAGSQCGLTAMRKGGKDGVYREVMRRWAGGCISGGFP